MFRFSSHRQSLIRVSIMQISLAFMVACSGADAVAVPPINIGTVFTIQVANETFKVQASSTTAAAAMRARLASGATGVIIGALLRGDGGVNAPYGWHLDPATVTPVDVAAEVCDGRPSDVQQNMTYWITTVRSFCPWSARVISVGS